MRRVVLAVVGLAALIALPACAGTGSTPEDGGTATTPGVTVTPSNQPGNPSTPTNPPPELTQPVTTDPTGEVTVTGTVVVSEVEMGCLLLEGYELVGGDPAVLRPGQRVRVTGRVATDMVSTCQQGPILVVATAEPV